MHSIYRNRSYPHRSNMLLGMASIIDGLIRICSCGRLSTTYRSRAIASNSFVVAFKEKRKWNNAA